MLFDNDKSAIADAKEKANNIRKEYGVHHELVKPINWNKAPELEQAVYNKLVEQFWKPEQISLIHDKKDWEELPIPVRRAYARALAGLTSLDSLQSVVGAPSLIPYATNEYEVEVYHNITFMEGIHAKSYSTIFMTLLLSEEIENLLELASYDEHLVRKQSIVLSNYEDESGLKRRAASTLLESFLFYSGFFLPIYLGTQGVLTGAQDIIKLIVRDEAVHGEFIGGKFMAERALLSTEEQAEIDSYVYDLFLQLWENELEYTQSVYGDIGLVEVVEAFLKYNANRAFQNMGYEPVFPAKESRLAVPAQVINGLADAQFNAQTSDFFSVKPSYLGAAGTSFSADDITDIFDGYMPNVPTSGMIGL